jgi:hypothetical protein
MASPSSNPFYGSSAGNTPANSGYQRLALDNLLRRELKVSDPNDPQQIANALLERFRDDPRANAITQEARGLPFLQSGSVSSVPAQAATSSSVELQQAKDDVERDLRELTTNSLLKDVTPEIQGWAQAVRSAIAEGSTAARFALDPRQRDKTFGIRRQLGDYARMARMVGALTPTLNMTYRKFAQSLDEVASVLLVMMGEALSNVGFNGGRFLLQAPYAELQSRRDAAIYALRNLIGATQLAYGPNDWPRGLDAYRVLFNNLETQGQGDFRALLVENELARSMDELIQRAAHGTADGLRALGSTALLDLERFRRLVIVGQNTVVPPSPPLTAFLEALQLFADVFDGSGGFRLLRVARPPILFYGLYGMQNMDDSDRILLDLIILRGQLADQLDCYLRCDCSVGAVNCQVVLDKILYDLDRAIDLYAMGKVRLGQPELRALAYSYVIEYFLILNTYKQEPPSFPEFPISDPKKRVPWDFDWSDNETTGNRVPAAMIDQCSLPFALFKPNSANQPGYLVDIINKLRPDIDSNDPVWAGMQLALTQLAGAVVTALDDITGTDLPRATSLITAISTAIANLANNQIDDLTGLYSLTQQGLSLIQSNILIITPQNLPSDNIKAAVQPLDDLMSLLQQELCIQRDMEDRWENLVRTMAPDCAGIDRVLNTVKTVIQGAIDRVGGQLDAPCPAFDPKIPPHFETSLGDIFDDSIGKT